jgi:hypothetical protein
MGEEVRYKHYWRHQMLVFPATKKRLNVNITDTLLLTQMPFIFK